MSTVLQDLWYALRALRKRPAFTAVVVATIAIGIGANTAIFSVVNGVLLQPLPLEKPDELVVPDVISTQGFSISLSIPNFRDWRERNRVFESFGANMTRTPTLTSGDRPEVVQVRYVLGDYFETLGVQPILGRVIESDETWEGAEPIAVVTHWFWQNRLTGDPNSLGRSVTLDGMTFTVVGVMPESFVFPSASTEIFLPMGYISEDLCWDSRGCSQGTWAIGRLKAGVTLEMAQADMDRVHREIVEMEGEDQAHAELQTLSFFYVGDIARQIWLLMGAVGFVLLIACANVASLLLARGEGRRREIALRSALGAGRARMVRLFLAESGVLALASGVLGIGIAFLTTKLMVPAMSGNLPSTMIENIALDGPVLLFTFAITIAAGLLFGFVPALRSASPDLQSELKEGGRGGSTGAARQRLRASLVVVEVALSLVLLIGGGLMIQSLRKLQDVDKGFTADNIFTTRIGLPGTRYDTKEKTWGFFEEYRDRIAALPGVEHAAMTQIVPLQGNAWEQSIFPEGVAIEWANANSVLYYMVSPEYFDILNILVLQGRTFDASDRDGNTLVAVIDKSMADRFWPGENPIGKRITFETAEGSTHQGPGPNPARVYRTVIGVTQNVRHYELELPSRIQVYVPMAQSERSWTTSMYLLVKTTGDPMAIREPVRQVTNAMDAEVPLYRVETMEGYTSDAMAGTRVLGGFFTVFSVLALLLSAIGIFGIMSYQVVQRLREIGIRMALGAAATDVVRMVAWQGFLVTSIGVAIGLTGAYLLSRLMTSLLFEIDPVDPVTYGGLAVVLTGIAVLAAYLPTRRATRIDPAIVLREE